MSSSFVRMISTITEKCLLIFTLKKVDLSLNLVAEMVRPSFLYDIHEP